MGSLSRAVAQKKADVAERETEEGRVEVVNPSLRRYRERGSRKAERAFSGAVEKAERLF